MASLNRLLSSVLFAAGLVLVCVGLSRALGFTAAGMLASVAVMAALLYAGAAWFGGAAAPAPAGEGAVMVFDRHLRIVAGPATGSPIARQFPAAARPEIEDRCRAALRGEHHHFSCDVDGRRFVFDVAPIAAASGVVLYGVLMSGSGAAVGSLTAAPAAVAS